MRQADLPRPRHRPAADQRRPGRRVVYFPEGSLPDQRRFRIHQPEYAIYPGDLQAFFLIRGRKDPGHTPGRHGFPAPRRPDHEQIMAACDRDLRRPSYIFLPLKLRKIRDPVFPGPLHFTFLLRTLFSLFCTGLSLQQGRRFLQAAHPDDLHAFHQPAFPGIFFRYDTPPDPLPGGLHNHRKDSRHLPHTAVQPQLADHQAVLRGSRRDLSKRRKDRRRDRQIKGRPALSHRGRGQIDHGALWRIFIA